MFLLLLNGCKKDATTAPTPPVTGDLIGSVKLTNEKGDYASNYSSVTVSVEGTNLSSQTDSSGNFSIKGVEKGDKIIAFSKDGYGTYKKGISIYDNSTQQLSQIILSELPPFNAINFSVKIITNGFQLSGGITNTLNIVRGLVVCAFSDSTVSADPSKFLFEAGYDIMNNSSSFTASVTFSSLLQKGFKSGQIVYFVAYGSIPIHYTYAHYYDQNGNTVYCCLSKTPSNKISITIP
jgi:hypothetical protein